MVFPRRRSLWLKIAVLGGAVWITVFFLLYTEDRAAVAVQDLGPSGLGVPQAANGFVPPAQVPKRETPGNGQSKPKINQAGPEQGIYIKNIHLSSFKFPSLKRNI